MTTDGITRVSVTAAGVQGNANSSAAALSADGRYVLFQSDASNLVAGDTNDTSDVFLRDLETGTLTRVSTGASGQQADSWSYSAAISADGRYATFTSLSSNLVPGDRNNEGGIFRKDVVTGEIVQVNTSAGGAQANGFSVGTSIYADGQVVAFGSGATNLVAGDRNNVRDIFVKDLASGTVTRASTGPGGVEANGDSYGFALSADGRVIAFDSFAWNLAPGDTRFGSSDVFVRNLVTGEFVCVSTNAAGAFGNEMSDRPSISADGRYVAFESDASNLVAGDTNRATDIFVRDMVTGTLTRVSTDSLGGQAEGYNYAPSISADGRFVAFETQALNWGPGWPSQIVVKDLQTGLATVVSLNAWEQIGNWHANEPRISADGRTVVFESGAGDLVAGDNNAARRLRGCQPARCAGRLLRANPDQWRRPLDRRSGNRLRRRRDRRRLPRRSGRQRCPDRRCR